MALTKTRDRMTKGAVVNVLDRNVTGLGVADDTAALNAAIAYAGLGGSVYVPNGTYKISSPVLLNENGVRLFGDGAARFVKAAATDAIQIHAEYCTVEGLIVDGAGFGASGIGIHTKYNTVRGCRVYAQGAHGIYCDGQTTTCQFNLIEGNTCEDNGGIGIATNTATDCRILGNLCQRNDLEGITLDVYAYRHVVSNNQVFQNCLVGGVGGIGWDVGNLCTVSNNIIADTRSGLPGIRMQNNIGRTQYCTITGNIFADNEGGGLHLTTNGANGCDYCVITGNVFHLTGTPVTIDAGCGFNVLRDNIYEGVAPANFGTGTVMDTGACSFYATCGASTQDNVTGDATPYKVNFTSVVHELGLECWNGTNTFTAPVKGRYLFCAAVRAGAAGGTHDYSAIRIVTTGLGGTFSTTVNSDGEDTYANTISAIIQMEASNTAYVEFQVGDGSGLKDVDISNDIQTVWFTGILLA